MLLQSGMHFPKNFGASCTNWSDKNDKIFHHCGRRNRICGDLLFPPNDENGRGGGYVNVELGWNMEKVVRTFMVLQLPVILYICEFVAIIRIYIDINDRSGVQIDTHITNIQRGVT